jgi:hypothetical protein
MLENFNHQQFAHCESGVVSTLLSHYGLKMSEPMAFGITSSLTFFYFPLIKLNGMPLVAYREVPKNIIRTIQKRVGIEIFKKQYKDPLLANAELTKIVAEEKKLVGLQTSVFYLPYMPKDMRFHFNAHNLLVYGKEGDEYLISDPVFEEPVRCKEKDLTIARFAKGVFAPKGFIYYPTHIPEHIDMKSIIKKAIKKNAKRMTSPFPYAGVKGMRKLAKSIEKLKSSDKEKRYTQNYLTHIVRMQEEIGTGGGGFRFLYSAFLQEALSYDIDSKKLTSASGLIVESGECLREFALACVKASKNIDDFEPKAVSQKLIEASKIEEEAFTILKSIDR